MIVLAEEQHKDARFLSVSVQLSDYPIAIERLCKIIRELERRVDVIESGSRKR